VSIFWTIGTVLLALPARRRFIRKRTGRAGLGVSPLKDDGFPVFFGETRVSSGLESSI